MYTLIGLLIWISLGLLGWAGFIFYYIRQVTIGSLFAILLCVMLGPIMLILVIGNLLLDSMEKYKHILSIVLWRRK